MTTYTNSKMTTPDKYGSHVDSENGRVQFVSSTTSIEKGKVGGGNIYNRIISKGGKMKSGGPKRVMP